MRIFLTGGNGFLGKQLLPLLAKHEVLMVGRRDINDFQDNVSYVRGDLSDLLNLQDKIKMFCPKVCINLAWQGLPDYSFSTCLNNFSVTLRFFEFLARIGCKTVFSAGTCWEYGEMNGRVHESDVPENMNLFASIKSGLYLAGKSIFNSCDINFIWGRFFFIYGIGQRETSLIPSCFQAVDEGKTPHIKNPDAINDFIHAQDAARAIVELIEAKDVSGVFNIGSGVPTKVGDICKIILKKKNANLKHPITDEPSNGHGLWADLSHISKHTKWTPQISIEEGIQMTIDSFDDLKENK